MFLDATYCKARVGGRVVSRAVVIAIRVSADGRREVLGVAVGDSETEVFWTDFLHGLRDRGLSGVQLVTSDSHRGLTRAIDTVLTGAARQRCRMHFMRNALARASKGQAEMVAAAIRTIFAQPTADTVREAVQTVATTLERQFPAVAMLLRDAREEITAFADVPKPLAQDLVDQSVGTAEQRGQAPHRRHRHLPRRPSSPPAGQLRAHRGPRRMAGVRPALPRGGLHGPAHPARAHRHRPPPPRPQGGDRPARPADGIVSTTAEQHATSYTTPRARPVRRKQSLGPGPPPLGRRA